jgi:ArsR family transcriptional regulator
MIEVMATKGRSKLTGVPMKTGSTGPPSNKRKSKVADLLACCTPVRSDLLDADEAALLATAFAALADPIRLRLLSCVASAGGDEVCACDLLEPSGRSQPTVSHHMKVLVDAGLVSREKRGLWVWYRIVPTRLDALRAALG